MEFTLGALATVGLIGLALAGKWAWERWKYRQWSKGLSKPAEVVYDECWCGEELNADNVHHIVELQDDLLSEDGKAVTGLGSGTALVADLCEEHCTGGCQRGCEYRDVPLTRKVSAE